MTDPAPPPALEPPDRARWRARVVLVTGIVLALFGLSAIAGTAGLFSSAARSVEGRLNTPATRLAAADELAEQFATSFASGEPTIPGSSDETTCPAPYSARSSVLIGALTPDAAARLLDAAAAQLARAGWRVAPRTSGLPRQTVSATRRRNLEVTVAQEAGDQLTTVRVTVAVRCPAIAPTTTTTPTST